MLTFWDAALRWLWRRMPPHLLAPDGAGFALRSAKPAP